MKAFHCIIVHERLVKDLFVTAEQILRGLSECHTLEWVSEQRAHVGSGEQFDEEEHPDCVAFPPNLAKCAKRPLSLCRSVAFGIN